MSQTLRFETLDPNFAAPELEGDWEWHSFRPEMAQGRCWPEETPGFGRLPARAEGVVRPAIWEIGRCSAGLSVEFSTDSCKLAASWQLGSERLAMAHMPASGMSGLDLYVQTTDGWRWAAAGRATSSTNTQELFQNRAKELRRFRMHLPLYNSVKSLRLAVEPGAQWEVHPPGRTSIVLYGTSIVQGGCASRPGMGYTAVLERRLHCLIANLGFSGNARCEPEMARLLAELEPALFVLDPLANVPVDDCQELMENFLEILISTRAGTPIAMVDDLNAPRLDLMGDRQQGQCHDWHRKRDIVAGLKKRFANQPSLHWLSGANLLGSDGEATVDGIHPTDLGFLRISEALAPQIQKLLPPANP